MRRSDRLFRAIVVMGAAITAIDASKRADAGVDAATSDKKPVPYLAIL